MDIILDSIQLKRGSKIDLPELLPGEPALCTDTGEIAIGTHSGSIFINLSTLKTAELKRIGINDAGQLTIDGVEVISSVSGAAGKSAFQIWLDNGNTGTITDFLNSLKGVKGDKGDTGAQGPQGIQGLKGDTGDTGPQGIQGIKGDKGDKGDPGPAGSTTLSGLTDVDFSTAPVENDVLQYVGGKFKPRPVSQGSGGNSNSNVYIVELSRWGISSDGTNPTATTTGLNNAITWAVGQGYNYIKLPSGTYLIAKGATDGDKTATLTLQSNMTLDIMGCTIKKETNAYNTTYTVYGKDIVNTTVYGGIVQGDRDTHDFSNTGWIYEWNIGIYTEGKCRNVEILGTEIKDFSGYSMSFNGFQYQHKLIQYSEIETGTYDSTTGAASTNANYIRTKGSYPISTYSYIYDIGSFMLTGNGYNSFGMRTDGGGVNLSNTIFTIYFYNASGTYLGSLQRRCFDSIPVAQFPAGAATIKISFRYDFTKIIPDTFYLGIDARQPMIGTRIANCKIHDSYALGIAMSVTALTTIENNEMYNIGYALQKIGRNLYPFPMAIDIEDGYNSNQHITIRNNIFRDNQSLHLSLTQVRNVLVEGNKFNGAGGITFQGTKGSNCVSRGNDYNLTSGSGQSATYVKFENDHFSSASMQISYECIYEDCVFDDFAFVAQADTWGDFATGTTYGLGTAVLPSGTKKNGYYYVCTTAAGASVSTEPTWKTDGTTTTDVAGNVWTAYTYNPTYDLIQFLNCKFRTNIPETTSGWSMRRFNLLFDNCRFDINTQRYLTDLTATWDFALKSQIVFKDCEINTSYTGSTFGGVIAPKVHIQRSKFIGLNDGTYPTNSFSANNLLIEESSFDSFYAEAYGFNNGIGTNLTFRDSRIKLDKSARRFGNAGEGFYIRNFDTMIFDNIDITLPNTSIDLRPLVIFAEKYLKIVNNNILSSRTSNNIELWGAYRNSSVKAAIPSLTAIIENNHYSKLTIKPDISYYAQLTKEIGNGFIDLDATAEGASNSSSSIPTSGYFYAGKTVKNSAPSAGGSLGWVSTVGGIANNTTWAAATAYVANALINSGGNVYQALTAGRSTAAAPTFPTTIGNRVDDVSGTSIWQSTHLYAVGDKVIPVLETSDPSSAPTLQAVSNAASTLTATRYYVQYTWVTATGETKGSSEAFLDIAAGNNLSITVPSFPAGVTKANVYVGTVTGQNKLQGSINTTGTAYVISAPVNVAIVPTPQVYAPLTSSTGYWYECTTGGTSGGTAPTWSKTANGTMVDGGVTWTVRGITTWKNIGKKAVFNEYGVISV